MKSRLYTNLTLTVLLGIFVAACSSTSKDKPTQLAELKAQQTKLAGEIRKLEEEIGKTNPPTVSVKAREVVTAELAPRKFDYYVQTQGAVEAEDNILVSAKTMGVITQVFANEGDVVAKGQVLAQIDNTITLRSIEEAKSSLELANTVYQRQKNLWDQKIGTEVQYLQAKNTKESLEKRLAILEEQLDMSRIKSPINGAVDEVTVKIGQNVAPGMPAVRVVSSSRLKLRADISEAYVTVIERGNKANLSFPDVNISVNVNVTFVGKTINQLSRTFPVELSLPANKDLRPNMTGVVKIFFRSMPAALVVPVNVVQDINGQKIVYVAELDGAQMVARRKVVEVGGVYDNLAEIRSGLKAGEKVITVGYQGLNDGEFVKN